MYNLPPAIKTLPFPNLLAIRKLTLHHLSISTSFPKQNHLLIRRVTNHITEGDVTSIRSLISQERSDCVFARSDFINIVQVCASSSEVEHPWYLCIPHRSSFLGNTPSVQSPVSDEKKTHPIVPMSPHMCHL